MYRLIAFSNGNEYLGMTKCFKDALTCVKKSRRNAQSIRVLNENNQCIIAYIKNDGLTINNV